MHSLLASGDDGFETRSWNNTPIARRAADGYVDATAMCKANGKQWNDYWRTDRATAYLKALGAETGFPVSSLCLSLKGGAHQGTWVHPQVAVDLARWISAEFAVWMDGWFLEALGQAPRPQPAPAPAPLPVDAPALAAAEAAKVLLMLSEHLAKVPGIKPGLLAACTVAAVQRSTGIDTSDLERALPAEDTLVGRLTPTEIGKILGLNSKKTNLLLAMYGFQVKNAARKWELTDKGLEFGELVPYNNIKNQHAGYRILWNQAIVEQLPLNAQP